jgi:hypothetical protein
VHFFERPPDGLVRDRLGNLELHEATSQQAQRPAVASGGGIATHERHEMGLLAAIETPRPRPRRRTVVQRTVRPLRHEAGAHAFNGPDADLQRLSDPGVGPGRAAWTFVRLQEDAGMGELAGRCGPGGHEGLKRTTIIISELDAERFRHAASLAAPPSRHDHTQHSHRYNPLTA